MAHPERTKPKKTKQHIYGLLGLSRRGGNLILGMDAVLTGICQGQVQLLVLASDASPNSARKAAAAADRRQVPYCYFGEGAVLGAIFNRNKCVILGLTDAGLAKAVLQAVAEYEKEGQQSQK
ncbi:MAG TPA: hypothetical protein GX717_07610 [Clostridiaceae bacterium]|nr:hypothetical protein [Clostridiaceae bacterium]